MANSAMQQVEQVLELEIGDCLCLEDGTQICVQRVRDGQVRLKILEVGEGRRRSARALWCVVALSAVALVAQCLIG